MEELVIKKDFTNIYIQETPTPYLEQMSNLGYRIADQTKPLYCHIAERMINQQKTPIKILDVGSSYGINSALMRHSLTMTELDEFFLDSNPYPSIKETKDFFEELPINDSRFEFYLNDMSQPALDFAQKVGLCNNNFSTNLEEEPVPEKFKNIIKNIDLIISTGCIGYIGWKTFENIFSTITSSGPNPIFAFTSLRIFPLEDIKQVFEKNGFEMIKTNVGPLKQRQFHDEDEKAETIKLLRERGIETKGLEEKGFYYADFYVGGPKKSKHIWSSWIQSLEDTFVPMKTGS